MDSSENNLNTLFLSKFSCLKKLLFLKEKNFNLGSFMITMSVSQNLNYCFEVSTFKHFLLFSNKYLITMKKLVFANYAYCAYYFGFSFCVEDIKE